MLKKLILPLFLLSSICTNNISADLIVLPRQESGSDLIARKFGEGIRQGLEESRRKRAQEEWKRAQQRENENRARIIQEILEKYDPSKTTEFAIKILQSPLPKDHKKMIVNCLDNQHKIYLLEKKKNKNNGIFSKALKNEAIY